MLAAFPWHATPHEHPGSPAPTNASDLDAGTGKGAQSGLSTGTRGLGLVAAGGAQLDVQRGDAKLLKAGNVHVISMHCCVAGLLSFSCGASLMQPHAWLIDPWIGHG